MSYKKTKLANHLRVVTHNMKERDSLALGLWIGSGGRHEEDRVKGIAHFLEHISFKGSQKYNCDEIKEKIEGIGGSLNAFTTEEQTCYYAKIPANHIAQTFDVLADMVFFPRIDAEDVEKERGVIIEEIKMYHDLPQYYVLELLDRLIWPDHPLGRSLAGTEASVSKISAKDLKDFHRQHYTAENVVISVSGKVKNPQILNLVKKKLSKIQRGTKDAFVKAENEQSQPKVNFYHKDTEQMHLALGMFGLPNHHPDRYALSLLNIIMGGNMSSRLFNEIREKRGLAYSISTSIRYLKDTGMFMVRAGVDNQKIVPAVELILKELKKIKTQGASSGEFTRAKDYYFGQVLLGLEDTLDHMLWIGESMMIYDHIRTMKEIIASIGKVTANDIRRMARTVLKEEKFNLALIGSLKDDQEKSLRSLMGIR